MNRTTVFLAAGMILGAPYTYYTVQAQEIASVSFDQGADYKFGEDVLRYNVQSRKGGMYNERTVNDDIKRLHAMGMFSDVASETRKTPDGKIEIIFKITPKPVVREVAFMGNKKYDTKKLREEVTVVEGVPLNDMALRNSADALRKFYLSKGLNDAIIIPKIEKIDENHIRIVFNIKENLRLRVGKVDFIGVTAYPADELRDAIATRHSFLSHPWFSWILDYGLLDREELGRDPVRLRELYWRKGYLDFKVKDVKVTEDPKDPEIVNVTFTVEEGEPYKVGKVYVDGAQRFKPEELIALIPLKLGMTFSNTLENDGAEALDNKYSRLGYADFLVRPIRIPNYKTHTVDLAYKLNEGPLYKIHDILISGNKYTKDHVIRRELPMIPGDPVDKNMVKVAKSRLMGMGYFEKVDAVAKTSEAGALDTKDIDIAVKEKRFIDAKIGGSWSDTDSLSGMLEITHSNMDILDPWNYFTGGGQRMRLLAVMGLERYNFELDFTEPWLFGIPLRWDVSGYVRNIDYDDWSERRIGFSTSLTKRIFDDFTTASIGYTFEQVRIHEMAHKLSEEFQKWKGNELVGRLHLSIERDTRNSATDPTRGYSIGGYASVTSQAFGATNDYARLEAKGTYHYSFFNDWFVFSAGGKVGFISNIGEGGMVPLFERYFMGGGDSVRGFPYRGIGPEDGNNDNYGGQTMYMLTAELSHPIYSIVRGAFFVDIGDAGPERFQFRTVNMGIGYGLRIKLPNVNAPIRLDLAFPIINKQDGVSNSLRFHFNMGASFGPH